jgi:hypothetical protein
MKAGFEFFGGTPVLFCCAMDIEVIKRKLTTNFRNRILFILFV